MCADGIVRDGARALAERSTCPSLKLTDVFCVCPRSLSFLMMIGICALSQSLAEQDAWSESREKKTMARRCEFLVISRRSRTNLSKKLF